ncbi:MAG: DUF2914 domain-containing protein [Deltaproteobacteria bacterium]|nr:DUF2914 domain-containing protein [Deltaproteobacteria bacterium]
MTAGSDDPRAPDDAIPTDEERDAAVEEAGTDDVPGGAHKAARPVSDGHAVGKDRRADADDEMARLMGLSDDEADAMPAPAGKASTTTTPEPALAEGDAGSGAAAERDAAEGDDAKTDGGDARASASTQGDAATDGGDARASGGTVDAAVQAAVATTGDARASATAGDDGATQRATTEDGEIKDVATARDAEATEGSATSGEPRDDDRPAAAVIPLARVRTQGESYDTEDDRPARASRPVEDAPEAQPAASSNWWPWVGVGAVALGAVAVFGFPGDDADPSGSTNPGPTSAVASVPRSDPPARPPDVPRVDEPAVAGSSDSADGDPTESGSTTASGDAPPRSADPREPPPGTDPAAAAAFSRLPVGPSDRPPVGGIGANGIHIDKISMGARVEHGRCVDHSTNFSVSRRERASVCVRVVHPREKEELQVLWQKHGGSTRRSKMIVKPMHAYRTRGHLKLRTEYIGDWTVRIVSPDGVELASQSFSVIP